MRLILVRHGETVWNAEFRVQGGNADTALSEKGVRQITRLAEVLRDEPVDLILSSPLQRAVTTAQTIGKYHQSAKIITDARLKEVNVGEFDGLSTVNMPQTFTELLLSWWKGGCDRLPGGESFAELQERTWGVVEPYVRDGTVKDIMVVSHYFTTLSIIFKALDFPMSMLVKFRMDPGCISVLEFGRFGPRLARFNDTSYQVV
ncbi:MAG: histidine phosphatase family protein [Dehalococcoidia bacterium]|nr:histidine phosphatase family protein [Dehalococcoidia bacterium]